MSRPDFDPSGTLRVLGYDYAVRAVHPDDIPTNDGTSFMARASIRVDETVAPDHKAQVVLHEILHAVDDGLNNGMDEDQIHRLARGLYAVVRDNEPYMKRLLFG